MATSGMLAAKEDLYGGVIIETDALPFDNDTFAAQLALSTEQWHGQGKRGVWLKVPLNRSTFVPIAVDQGFKFHHAEPEYLMMTRWLPSAPNTLPANASHQVGVGALVINSKREVLVVQERSGPLKGKAVWKMPTGVVACGEDFTVAVERELFEETGVTARFDAVLAIRQAHGFAFNKSDLFIVCGMRPEPDVQEVRPQEAEIVAAAWVPLDTYVHQEFFKGMPIFDKMMDRCAAWADGKYRGMRVDKLKSSVTRPRNDLLVFGDDDVV